MEEICTRCKKYPKAPYSRSWCTACLSEHYRKWARKNPDKVKSTKAKYKRRNSERIKEKQTLYRKQRRLDILIHYGGDPPKCDCCGETILEFLCLDHRNGGGNKHRKALGVPSGAVVYQWVKNHGFPKGFRVLCYNCNNSYGHYNYCPHSK